MKERTIGFDIFGGEKKIKIKEFAISFISQISKKQFDERTNK